MCSNLYAHFLHTLREASYYPPGAEQISDHRLFGMYHSCTDDHNKSVIMDSLCQPDGVVRVVFATMALGMGVDFKDLVSTMELHAHLRTIFRTVVELAEISNSRCPQFIGSQSKLLSVQTILFTKT